MPKGLIVVTGATGNIGKPLVEALLAGGAKVRAVARNADKLDSLNKKGAEVFAGSVKDEQAMKQAFAGAEAAFLMLPPDYKTEDMRKNQNAESKALAAAVQAAGVKYVVQLSSIGANLSQGAGPINGLYDSEQRFNKLDGVAVLNLRPTYFMENLLGNVPLIKHSGIAGSPMKGDIAIPMIATKDIAAVAARRLLALDFKGRSALELLGPRDYSMNDAARVLGAAIGKADLKYVQFPYDDAQKAMVGMGLSADVARLFIEMAQGFNDGLIKATQPRSKDTNTPTTLEEFSKVFAAAFKAS